MGTIFSISGYRIRGKYRYPILRATSGGKWMPRYYEKAPSIDGAFVLTFAAWV
jgi:hypothetical protein